MGDSIRKAGTSHVCAGRVFTSGGGRFRRGVRFMLLLVLVTFLELFVSFLQAFIFMFLTAVFISLMSHHDEEHDHDEEHETIPDTEAIPA